MCNFIFNYSKTGKNDGNLLFSHYSNDKFNNVEKIPLLK